MFSKEFGKEAILALIFSVAVSPIMPFQTVLAAPIIEVENDFEPDSPEVQIPLFKVVLCSLYTKEEAKDTWIKNVEAATTEIPPSRGQVQQSGSAFHGRTGEPIDAIYLDFGLLPMVYPLHATYKLSSPAILNKIKIKVTHTGGPKSFQYRATVEVIPEDRKKIISLVGIPSLETPVYRDSVPETPGALEERK
jgi:hypothetical protein